LKKWDIEEGIIDDDESVFKALNIGEERTNVNKRVKYRLEWKKCIFMNNFIENIVYCRDSVRLDLMDFRIIF